MTRADEIEAEEIAEAEAERVQSEADTEAAAELSASRLEDKIGDHMTTGQEIAAEAVYKSEAAIKAKDRIVERLDRQTAAMYEKRAADLAAEPSSYEDAHREASKTIANSAESR